MARKRAPTATPKPKPSQGRVDPDYFDPPHGDRPPSDAAVHAATQRYITNDFKQHGKHYEPEDRARVLAILMGTGK